MYLGFPFKFAYVIDSEPHPLILPRPCLPVCPEHDTPQAIVMDEAFNLRLKAPISKLNLNEFVRAHDDTTSRVGDPVLRQRATPILLADIQTGVFILVVIIARELVIHDVYHIWVSKVITHQRSSKYNFCGEVFIFM